LGAIGFASPYPLALNCVAGTHVGHHYINLIQPDIARRESRIGDIGLHSAEKHLEWRLQRVSLLHNLARQDIRRDRSEADSV